MAKRKSRSTPRQAVPIGEVELKTPIVHIVRPVEEFYRRGNEVTVKKPVELHIIQDSPDFKERFPDELLSVVGGLRREGVRRINIPIEPEGPESGFILKTAVRMGFYPHKDRLLIYVKKFDEYAKQQERKT